MSELVARAKRHFKFSNEETVKVLVSCLVIAFGLTLFPAYGLLDFVKGKTAQAYVFNFLLIFLAVLISLFVHLSVQKLVSIRLGYLMTYTQWMTGLVLSVFFSVITLGYLPIYFTGALHVKEIPKLRLGVKLSGVLHRDLGVIMAAGPLANMLFVAILSFFFIAYIQDGFLKALVVINLFTALFSLIPLPTFENMPLSSFKGGTPGLYLLIVSRPMYVFVATAALIYSLLIIFFQVFAYILALAIALIVTVIYYYSYVLASK